MKYHLHFFITCFILSCTSSLAQQKSMHKDFSLKGEEGKGLVAEYFNGPNFEEKVLTRIDEKIDFFFETESQAPGVNAENYSIRWKGHLYAPLTGKYKIIVTVDDGVRMWVNGYLVLEKWKTQVATTYSGYLNFEGGEFYDLKIEYFNKPGIACMQLMWELPQEEEENNSFFNFFGFFSSSKKANREVIPSKYLYDKLPEQQIKQEPVKVKTEEQNTVVSHKKKEETHKPEAQKIEKKKPGQKRPAIGIKEVAKEEKEEKEEEKVEEEVYENLKPGAVVSFDKAHFEQGKYILLEGASHELDKLARTMLKYPDIRIRIEGHTDNVGDPALNQSLSYFRAKVVQNHLLERGIDVLRIQVKGHGSSRPLADNSTEEGRAKNRRVEFVVLP